MTRELKYYSVYVRYEETDNYLPSDGKIADARFLFTDKITILVKVTEGINLLESGKNSENLEVKVGLQEDYFLPDGAFTVQTEGNDKGYIVINGDLDVSDDVGHYSISSASGQPPDNDITITITISGAKKAASIESMATAGQKFDAITDQDPVIISNDSAFTLYYGITAYDATDYEMPELSFSPTLPAGTKIIMQDKEKNTYWKYTASTETNSIDLDCFTRMGDLNDTKYSVNNGDLQLQFVVDFSGVTENMLESNHTLTAEMNVAVTSARKASELSSAETIHFGSTSFVLTLDTASGLSRTLQYEKNSSGDASKWESRDMALVVQAGSLPPDARIWANINGANVVYESVNGSYKIPLGETSDKVILTLESKMLSNDGTTYDVDAALYVAMSQAGSAPMNGDKKKTESITFTCPNTKVSVDVKEQNNKRLFMKNESITVRVTTAPNKIPQGYKMDARLLIKNEGIYNDTTTQPKVSDNTYTFDFTNSGSYCVMVNIEQENGLVVMQVPYYFIVKDDTATQSV